MSLQAAIDLLRLNLTRVEKWWAANKRAFTVEGKKANELELGKLRQALVFLEAAEKVDKKIALEALRELRYLLVDEDERDADFIKQWHLIRALLFALPDKE